MYPFGVRELSLLMQTDEDCNASLCFVYWKKDEIDAMIGRVARIDLENKVIYDTSTRATSFADCVIIHPAIGCTMTKGRTSSREELPAGIVLLKKIMEVALRNNAARARSSTGTPYDNFSKCAVCQLGTSKHSGQSGGLGRAMAGPMTGPARLAQTGEGARLARPTPPHRARLP